MSHNHVSFRNLSLSTSPVCAALIILVLSMLLPCITLMHYMPTRVLVQWFLLCYAQMCRSRWQGVSMSSRCFLLIHIIHQLNFMKHIHGVWYNYCMCDYLFCYPCELSEHSSYLHDHDRYSFPFFFLKTVLLLLTLNSASLTNLYR